MTSKSDYERFQQEFLELKHKNPNLSVQEFCESVGLNYASAKRYIKANAIKKPVRIEKKNGVSALAKRTKKEWLDIYAAFLVQVKADPTLTIAKFSTQIGEQKRRVQTAFADAQKNPRFNDLHKAVAEAKERLKESKKKPPSRRAKPLALLVGESDPNNEQIINDHKMRQAAGRDQSGRFIRGNACGVVHGGYAAACGLDQGMVSLALEIDPASVSNELTAARTQYIYILNYLNRSRELIEQRYANGDPIKDSEGNAVPMETEILRMFLGTSDKLRSIENSIASLVNTHVKAVKELTMTDLKERESRALSVDQLLAKQSQLLRSKYENEWSAADTVRRFEEEGINAPEFLLYEAKIEIENYVPPVDDDGISDEELDRITQDYIDGKAADSDWIESRREEVRHAFEIMDAQDAGLTPDEIAQSNIDDTDPADTDHAAIGMTDLDSVLAGVTASDLSDDTAATDSLAPQAPQNATSNAALTIDDMTDAISRAIRDLDEIATNGADTDDE